MTLAQPPTQALWETKKTEKSEKSTIKPSALTLGQSAMPREVRRVCLEAIVDLQKIKQMT